MLSWRMHVAAFNEVALLNGATMEGLEAHDLGRDFIYPFLQKQALLQNCPIEGQRFAFPGIRWLSYTNETG